MSINTILQEVNELTASFNRQREELVKKLKPAFGSIFQPFLDKYKEVHSFYFTAYTPYFNDGDECTFSVHDLYLNIVDEETEEYEEETHTYGTYYGSLLEVAEFMRSGKLPAKGSDPYGAWQYQLKTTRTTGWGHDRKTETMLGEQDYETWFRNKHKEVMEGGLEEVQRRAERDADFTAIQNAFAGIPDDIIQSLFGDHIRVTISRNGVEVDDYDHS